MLLRLHDRHGLQKIGLEGAIQSPRPEDGSWFHTMGGDDAKAAREEVAVRMLAEGEISSAEFITILFPDVSVHGIELQSQYDVKMETEGSPQMSYLIKIAEKGLSQSEIRQVNGLIREEKIEKALNLIIESDPWALQRYKAMQDPSQTSVEGMLALAREIYQKGRELGVEVESGTEQGMKKVIHFFEAASLRSDTMVDYVLGLPGVKKGAPVAMIIGAGHTDKVLPC